MTTEQLIDQAAKAHAKKSTAPDMETPDWIEQDFKAGASFYEEKIMAGKIREFGQWLWRNYRQIDAQVWKQRDSHSGTVYTMTELVNLFLEHLKHNQDATK